MANSSSSNLVLSLDSSGSYSPSHANNMYQRDGNMVSIEVAGPTPHRIMGRVLTINEDDRSATEYAGNSQTVHHQSSESNQDHSPVDTKEIPVAHSSQYSTHPSLVHTNYDAFYSSSPNNSTSSQLVSISTAGQILNGHSTPTVVHYAAPQHHVRIND